MPTYYTYKDPNPSTLSDPNAGTWENPADWPRVFGYLAAYDQYQGLHPPAPVYQSNQQAQPAYYYGQPTMPAGYYANGTYYQPQAPPGWPYNFSPPHTCQIPSPYTSQYPYSHNCAAVMAGQPMAMQTPFCATQLTAQAAAAAASNAALAAMPTAPAYFVGATPAEIQAQNAIIAMNTGATMPTQLAPYKPANGQQFWCKELDGSWTLRTHEDIVMGDVSPGHWEKHATSGYFYWVRHAT